jgi:hypothetical protein
METNTNSFESGIDTQLADLYAQTATVRTALDSAVNALAYDLGHRGTIRPALAELLVQVEGNDDPRILRVIAGIERHQAALAAIREQQAPLEAIFDARQWSRFFLVTNTNGHIHSSLNCSTCRWDTQFAWLPNLSGLTEQDAVEEWGGILCSVCFPSAPVEHTSGENKKTAAERDASRAERQVKQAAKAAKAILRPDGSVLKGKWGIIKTEVTARRELVDALAEVSRWNEGNLLDHPNHDRVVAENTETADRIIEALAAKTGEDADTLKAEAITKAAKKRIREGY